jgi:hypothetical protein
MTDRIAEELALLRARYSGLEFLEAGLWCKLASYTVPGGRFNETEIAVAFQIPPNIPGQDPYGFWTHPGLTPAVAGTQVTNYTFPASTGFGDGWGQFSWAPENWRPGATASKGDNMVTWVSTFAHRLLEGP